LPFQFNYFFFAQNVTLSGELLEFSLLGQEMLSDSLSD
jgi:hypothetical protein